MFHSVPCWMQSARVCSAVGADEPPTTGGRYAQQGKALTCTRTRLALLATCSKTLPAAAATHIGNVAPTLAWQVFNNTPDETAFYRLCLNREDVGGALTMIQPTLQSYGFDGPPTPVRPLASRLFSPHAGTYTAISL